MVEAQLAELRMVDQLGAEVTGPDLVLGPQRPEPLALALERVDQPRKAGVADAARKVPTRTAPNLLIRAMAIFDPSVRSVIGDLGKRSWFSSEKARSTLGWTPRPAGDSIEDCARSLL